MLFFLIEREEEHYKQASKTKVYERTSLKTFDQKWEKITIIDNLEAYENNHNEIELAKSLYRNKSLVFKKHGKGYELEITKMNIQEYYKIILDKIANGNFKVKLQKQFKQENNITTKDAKQQFKNKCSENAHLETIHYLMYEFWLDRNDPRITETFNYICIPHGVNGTKLSEIDIDFTSYSVKQFIKEIMKLKTIK